MIQTTLKATGLGEIIQDVSVFREKRQRSLSVATLGGWKEKEPAMETGKEQPG